MDEERISLMKIKQEDIKASVIKENTRRLIVHSITLENFKSYQGKQVIGPFDNVGSKVLSLEVYFSYRSKRIRKIKSA